MGKFIFLILRIVFILTLPFIALIRGAVYFHEHYLWSPWFSIIGGMCVAGFILLIYFSFVYGKVTGKLGTARSFKHRLVLVLFIIIAYSAYAMMYLSDSNVKSSSVKATYSSLHPILRLSISTILFIDNSLIITDAKRVPEDYKKMGLKSKKQSLHYVQSNGYVHAVDIRTNGHGAIRNRLLQLYFRGMGLNTLRHVGTADHLHISLTHMEKPRAI